jgi:hypothetical protein
MPGDFTRNTFNSKKHYSGVLMQQGRVQLDADWNEEGAIQRYRIQTQTKDVIGPCGVPKAGDSFKITAVGGSDVAIAPGRIYVGGLLCELDAAATYLAQPHYPNPDKTYFTTPLSSPPDSPVGSPPGSPPVPQLKDGAYAVYIDAWQRELNYLDEPLIHEVALGEADTTARLQNVWQIRLLQLANTAATCDTDLEEWKTLVAPASGKLNVQTTKVEDPDNPCLLPPKAGYQSLENQLYRVEVQKSSATRAGTMFKWSRDNASVETQIEKVEGAIITVSSVGKDDVLGFAGGQWVEVVDEESTLKSSPNSLLQIVSVVPSRREITLSAAPIPNTNNGSFKLRRWDQNGSLAGSDGVAAATGWMDLENGIQVNFLEGSYRAGDYWLIPARTATGEVEWPPYQIPNNAPEPQSPAGIRHYYCKLALLQVQGGKVTAVDCRPLFPSLTAICAEDVCYDNRNCNGSTAKTVQQALDELCRKGDAACTLIALPGQGWEKVFEQIGPGQDAQICFQVGNYPLDAPVTISGKGHLKLTGCGPGTRILAPASECALRFSNCKTVIVRDLYAETGVARFKKGSLFQNLNGTLSFQDCNVVEVSGAVLKCGTGTVKAANCIAVHNGANTKGAVTIQDCILQVGHMQQGVLLVNAGRSYVRNNAITVYNVPQQTGLRRLLQDRRARATVRNMLVSRIHVGEKAPAHGLANVKRTFGERTVFFTTERSLQKTWNKIFEENPPPEGASSEKELHQYVKKLSDRILVTEALRARYRPVAALLEATAQEQHAVLFQGITIGGRRGHEIHVLDNTVESSLQGIHIGLSHRSGANETDDEKHDHTGGVLVANNTIRVRLPRNTGKMERHGIFVGNCDSLVVENNNIKLERLEGAERIPVDGIRVWGFFGKRVMITKNFVASADENQKQSFTIGINVHPLLQRPSVAQWLVMYNVAPSVHMPVRVVNGAVDLPGTNAG